MVMMSMVMMMMMTMHDDVDDDDGGDIYVSRNACRISFILVCIILLTSLSTLCTEATELHLKRLVVGGKP